jgi:hypothetical protein
VKLAQLWKELVPDEDQEGEPIDLKWAEFPRFFTQKANGSFC